MKRGILFGGGIVILLIAGGAYYLFSNLEDIIQANVEKYGSEITQAEVTLDKVELDLTSGKGTLRGFKVGNPQGFQTPSAFQLGAVSIQIDIGTITDDPVIIKEIVIDKPDVTYESAATATTSTRCGTTWTPTWRSMGSRATARRRTTAAGRS